MAKLNDAIISIKPNFAEAILSGAKSIELRRRIPPIDVNSRLWIYATRPIGAIVGSATVERIIRGTPNDVWAKGGNFAGIDRASYDAYFDGAVQAVGLVLTAIQRGTPVSIVALRSMRPGFHPPQVIARISDEEVSFIRQHLES